MSVIVKPETLELLFPTEKLENGIEIRSNVEPAEPVEAPSQPPVKCRGNVFPYLQPNLSGKPEDVDPEERKIKIKEDEEVMSTRHQRSDSIEAIASTPKSPWNIFNSQRPVQPQPDWSPEDHPFAKHGTMDNNSWWQNDLSERYSMLREWDEKNWVKKECSDMTCKNNSCNNMGQHWERSLSEKLPEHTVPDVDYMVMASLSKTYVSDRNYGWYRENIEKANAAENAKACNETERQYKNELKTAKKLCQGVRKKEDQVRRSPDNLQYRAELKTWKTHLARSDEHLELSTQTLVQLRKDCGYAGTSLVAGLDQDYIAEKAARDSAVDRPAQPRQRLDETQKAVAAIALAESDHKLLSGQLAPVNHVSQPNIDYDVPTVRDEQVCDPDPDTSQISTRSTSEASIPFPDYKDPMVEQTAEVEAADVYAADAKLQRRSLAGRQLAELLENTGVMRERCVSWQLPSPETVYGSPPPTPVTPQNWVGATRLGAESQVEEDKGEGGDVPVTEPALVDEDVGAEEAAAREGDLRLFWQVAAQYLVDGSL